MPTPFVRLNYNRLCKAIFLSLALPVLVFTNAAARDNKRSNKSAKTIAQRPLSFIENKGQVTDQFHQQRTDIDLSLHAANGLNIFIGEGAIRYQFGKTMV